MAVIYNAQANQPTSDTRLIDYGPKRLTAYLSGAAAFVADAPNGDGNSLNFPDGKSAATTYGSALNTDSNFTALLWLKLPEDQDGKIAALAVWGEAGPNQRAIVETTITTNQWHHVAAVKEGVEIRLYVDFEKVGAVNCWGEQLTAFAFTENNEEDMARAKEAGVLIYNFALTPKQLKLLASMNTYLTYSLDGLDFKSYNVYVSDSDGLLDRPKLKSPNSVSWADEHGTYIDLKAPKLESRDITLKCFIYADSKLEFSQKAAAFLEQFNGEGLHRLKVDIDETHPLIYDVYAPNAVAVDKRWREGLMVGEFSLKLSEPAPVKKVIRYNRTDSTALTVTIKQRETAYNHLYTVAWGDGSTEEFTSQEITLTHNYSANGIYYAVIAGDIDNITETGTEEARVTTNGVIVWSKI